MSLLVAAAAVCPFSPAHLDAAPLAIDLTKPAPPFVELQLNQGSNRDPQGHTLTVDSQSLLLDGQPWVEVVGEFHYSRYPRADWRDELLKMKAGGCTAVSTYVLWIVHEEEQGTWDWSDQRSLHDFVQLCQELGLKVFLRAGPWAHGEARNGGFPDWVQNSGTKLRTDDPAFLTLVKPLYQQIAGQTRGLYWKDGGPIVGVQVDNECDNPQYLLALKAMAREVGIDAPFYLMTGWNKVPIPKHDLLPVFGAYAWGCWQPGPAFASFVFTTSRNDKDMGAQMSAASGTAPNPAAPPVPAAPTMRDPYLTAELGGGMQSSYLHRFVVTPDDVASINVVRLGDGNTMPGFYMYQGGINPQGKSSFFNEAHPNEMPLKDYDFQAPLGACGEVRPHYHLLREQNLFLHDFGSAFIRMTAYLPALRPPTVTDLATVRWAMRWKDNAGFLLFNNYQPETPLPDHPGVQFQLQTTQGRLLVPAEPVTIPSGSYGIWPINLDCGGARLQYATAQPLAQVEQGADHWYFFKAFAGIDPDFAFSPEGLTLGAGKEDPASPLLRFHHLTPGTGEAFALTTAQGAHVHFVVLDEKQAAQFWCAPFGGQDRVILSSSTVLSDDSHLRLQTEAPADFSFAVFPPVSSVRVGADKLTGTPDGVFARFQPAAPAPAPLPEIELAKVQEVPAGAPELPATDENAWKNAAVWKLSVPPAAARHLLLHLSYLADAVRVYDGTTLVDDNYSNSRPLDVGLWRLPAEDWSHLTVQVVPYSAKMLTYLSDSLRSKMATAAPSEQNKLTASLSEQLEIQIDPDTTP